MEHTKEPWQAWNNDGDWTIEAMNKRFGCMADIGNASFSEANARRIVACVNACKDFESPSEGIEDSRKLAKESYEAACKFKEQRDELLAALKCVLTEPFVTKCDCSDCTGTKLKAISIIAKCEELI